jgi:hypothetical protein
MVLVNDDDLALDRAADLSNPCSASAAQIITLPPPDKVAHTRVATATCYGSTPTLASVRSELFKRSRFTGGRWNEIDPPGPHALKTLANQQQARVTGNWICDAGDPCRGVGTYKHVATVRLLAPNSHWVDSNDSFLCEAIPDGLDCLYIRTYTTD